MILQSTVGFCLGNIQFCCGIRIFQFDWEPEVPRRPARQQRSVCLVVDSGFWLEVYNYKSEPRHWEVDLEFWVFRCWIPDGDRCWHWRYCSYGTWNSSLVACELQRSLLAMCLLQASRHPVSRPVELAPCSRRLQAAFPVVLELPPAEHWVPEVSVLCFPAWVILRSQDSSLRGTTFALYCWSRLEVLSRCWRTCNRFATLESSTWSHGERTPLAIVEID